MFAGFGMLRRTVRGMRLVKFNYAGIFRQIKVIEIADRVWMLDDARQLRARDSPNGRQLRWFLKSRSGRCSAFNSIFFIHISFIRK